MSTYMNSIINIIKTDKKVLNIELSIKIYIRYIQTNVRNQHSLMSFINLIKTFASLKIKYK